MSFFFLIFLSKEGIIFILIKDIINDMEGIYYFQKFFWSFIFVIIVLEGRVWIMFKKNYWRLCYGIVIMILDNYLLVDLFREYLFLLLGCIKYDLS